MAASRMIVDGPSPTHTSRSSFSTVDVQEIKLSSDCGEFRKYGERTRKTRSLNDLVRAQEQRLRDREPEPLRSLEVDHELETGWLLNGQNGGIHAFLDLV